MSKHVGGNHFFGGFTGYFKNMCSFGVDNGKLNLRKFYVQIKWFPKQLESYYYTHWKLLHSLPSTHRYSLHHSHSTFENFILHYHFTNKTIFPLPFAHISLWAQILCIERSSTRITQCPWEFVVMARVLQLVWIVVMIYFFYDVALRGIILFSIFHSSVLLISSPKFQYEFHPCIS